MGLATVLTTALKYLTQDQVVNVAMQYGPEIVRKIRDRLQPRGPSEAGETVTVEQLSERVRELESALVKQEEIIEQQGRSLALLAENGRILQARLKVCMAVATAAAFLTIATAVALFWK